ncbi:hypothetical protein ABE354_25475 [Brevibacillus laterosporus]|uniref:hypothetical protein n=1 Tax=Brevibacillus laterosporus TaxID=1465 RepID=UPI003D1E2F67
MTSLERQQLIEAITNEVITRLDTLRLQKKPKIFVFSPNESEWLAIKSFLTEKFDVHSVVANDLPCAQEWSDDPLECNVQSFSFILLTGLHCCTLASVALGLNTSVNVITQALLQGKKVYLLQEGLEYRQYRHTAPAHLYELYQSYEQKLVTFGVTLIKKADIHLLGQEGSHLEKQQTQVIGKISSEQLDDHVSSSVKTIHSNGAEEHDIHLSRERTLMHAPEEVWHIKQRVISESVLKKLFLQGAQSFTILPNAILTPLARDFVRMNQLIVKKTKQEGKNA